MKEKNELRKKYSDIRNSLSESKKNKADRLISENIFSFSEYIEADLVLIYISVGNEVSTTNIINHAFDNNKRVAIPYCHDEIMDFYEIKSVNELSERQFGVPTVNPESRLPVMLTAKTLCIVPALSVDIYGNRLGYGGGYYDRFLSLNNINNIVLIRECSFADILPAESYDVKIKNTATEKRIIRNNY